MKRVLIVDDEPTILLTLSHLLSNLSVSVVTTGDIEEAEEAISARNVDLVVADIRLNGAHGYEGLRLLDFVKKTSPDTRVIIMTVCGTAEMKDAAYEKGAWHYCEKPIDTNGLLEKVAALGIPVREPGRPKNRAHAGDEAQERFQF